MCANVDAKAAKDPDTQESEWKEAVPTFKWDGVTRCILSPCVSWCLIGHNKSSVRVQTDKKISDPNRR